MKPSERAVFVQHASAALPDGFRVVDEDGVFYLLSPSGDHIDFTDTPDDSTVERWTAEANRLITQGVYSEHSARRPDLPLSLILNTLERDGVAADERALYYAEAKKQAEQLERFFARERAAKAVRTRRLTAAVACVVLAAFFIVALGPDAHDRALVTPAGKVVFWVWVAGPPVAMIGWALWRRSEVGGLFMASVIWAIAAVMSAVALQVVAGWLFYTL